MATRKIGALWCISIQVNQTRVKEVVGRDSAISPSLDLQVPSSSAVESLFRGLNNVVGDGGGGVGFFFVVVLLVAAGMMWWYVVFQGHLCAASRRAKGDAFSLSALQ